MLRQTTTLVSRLGLRGTPTRCLRNQLTSSARSTGGNGRKIGFTLLAAGGLATTVAMTLPNASAESSPQPDCPPTSSIHTASYGQMARSYFVYTLCSIPLIIDYAPSLLHTFTHSPIPGLKSITEGVVRYTFFAQFVPGENVEECKPAMKDLRSKGVGTMLNYSAEADVDEHTESGDAGKRAAMVKIQDARLREVERALDQAGEFEAQVEQEGGMRGSTGFALKITGLIDPDILHRASMTLLRLRPLTQSNSPSSPRSITTSTPYPGSPISADGQVVARTDSSMSGKEVHGIMALSGELRDMGVLAGDEGLREGDLEELSALWVKLKTLGQRAQKNGVRLMIDAEHTWYQPALDAYTLLLSQEFNRPPSHSSGPMSMGKSTPSDEWSGPIIYGTYQSYLTRQPALLLSMLRHAEENGYALGVKLVRGAYFVQEREKWKKEGRFGPDPIWPDKPLTDLCYNTSISTIISTLSAQLIGPHPEMALSVVFGTHNNESVEKVIDELKRHNLAIDLQGSDPTVPGKLRMRDDVKGKVFIAQLYGMKDDLMDRVTEAFEPSTMPVALKYIAYGKLSEVMPFLGRRAIENKSLMSGDAGAAAERSRISSELKRRWLG